MSVLPETFANQRTPLYAAPGSGGGGGGTGSTLISPASITPDANGAASLSINVSTGEGVAELAVSNTTGNDAIVSLTNADGGNSLIQMGVLASPVGLSAPSLANAGQLHMGAVNIPNGDIPSPNVVVDTVNDAVTVYNLLGVGNPSFQNILAAAPLTANSAKLSQTVASGGIMSIGSSTANPAGLIVSDLARTGVTNYVQVSGPPSGNTSLFLRGGQTAGAACAVAADAPSGGTLWLGSSSTPTAPAAQGIVLTDAATTINQLGGAPVVLLPAVASITSPYTNSAIPIPPSEGLWCVMVTSVPTSNQASRDAQLMTMCYVNSAQRIQMGGNGSTSVIGGGVLDLYPLDGTALFALVYTGTGQGLSNISVVAFKISGPIPGTV
jgi:hypothetical protein